MRVVVTGGNGFIGSHVVDHLVDAGHEVGVIDLAPSRRPDVAHHKVDIADLEGLVRATEGADAVFHLAAFADVNDVAADPVGATDANVVGTARVWEACRRNGVKRAILASTVWVYGAAADADVLTETATFDLERAGHLYTSSKISAELVVQSYHTLFGQEFTVLRYGIPYGPRMRPSLVIPKFVTMALAGDPITIQGDGSQHRNYVYVGDLADAHVLCLEDAGVNQVFNLEGSERVTMRHLVECIGEALAIEPNITYIEARAGDYDGAPISAKKTRDVLGWNPAVTFSDGLGRYVDWHLETVVPATAAAALAPAVESITVAAGVEVAIGDSRPNVLAGVAAAVLLVPAIASLTQVLDDGRGTMATGVLASIAAIVAATVVGRSAKRLIPVSLGLGLCLSTMWLLPQAGWSPVLVPLAALLGIGLGALSEGLPRLDRQSSTVTIAVTAVLVSGAERGGVIVFWLGAAMAMLIAFDTLSRVERAPRVPTPRAIGASAALGLTALVVAGMVGATSTSASWFGPVVQHGPRNGGQVAVTFEGVSDRILAAQLVRSLNDEHSKGTFFIGPSSEQQTSVGKQVLATGQLIAASGSATNLGNPDRGVGVCPSFYRPSRGWHSPMLAQQARAHGITLVTWDVRMNNRKHTDADHLAASILRKAKPGSIVVLDFSVGDAHDQAEMAAAVPLVLRALDDRSLVATGLDGLLGGPAYAGRCN